MINQDFRSVLFVFNILIFIVNYVAEEKLHATW